MLSGEKIDVLRRAVDSPVNSGDGEAFQDVVEKAFPLLLDSHLRSKEQMERRCLKSGESGNSISSSSGAGVQV